MEDCENEIAIHYEGVHSRFHSAIQKMAQDFGIFNMYIVFLF